MNAVEAGNFTTTDNQLASHELMAAAVTTGDRELREFAVVPDQILIEVGAKIDHLLLEASASELAQGELTFGLDNKELVMTWSPPCEITDKELADLRAEHQESVNKLTIGHHEKMDRIERQIEQAGKDLLFAQGYPSPADASKWERGRYDPRKQANRIKRLEAKAERLEVQFGEQLAGLQAWLAENILGGAIDVSVVFLKTGFVSPGGEFYQRVRAGELDDSGNGKDSATANVFDVASRVLTTLATVAGGFIPGITSGQANQTNAQLSAAEAAVRAYQDAQALIQENPAGFQAFQSLLPNKFRLLFINGELRVVVPGDDGAEVGFLNENTVWPSGEGKIGLVPPETAGPTTHVVRSGETLTSIAFRYRVTVEALIAANNIRNQNLIFAGQRLVIPGVSTEQAREAANVFVYTVQPGDTLYAIAWRYGVSPSEIQKANDIQNPNKIFLGQTLRIPVEGGVGGPAMHDPYVGGGPGEVAQPPQPPTPEPTPQSPWARVKSRLLNFRNGPGTAFGVLTTLTQGTQLSPDCMDGKGTFPEDDDWLKAQDPQGKTGWVSANPALLEVGSRDQIPPCPSDQIPRAPTTPPTETAIETSIVEIDNGNSNARVALSPAWNEQDLKNIVSKYKPGWQVRIEVTQRLEDLPRRWEGGPHGVVLQRHGQLLIAHWAVYDHASKVATYYFFPGEGFRTNEPRNDGDKYPDFAFTQEFFYFLFYSDSSYMLPGGLGNPPKEFVDDMSRYVGVPAYGSEKNQALFEWTLIN